MNQERHIRVSIDRQRLSLVEHGKTIREYAVSTSSRGTGFTEGSFRTPTGNFRIVDKIGHEASPNTVFKGRVPVDTWQPGTQYEHDLILARILRLDGLDPENANTLERFIYIHGTDQKDQLGRTNGHGCVRMAPGDIIDLFRMVTEGMRVVIEPQAKPKGGLFFVDCDSTLSAIEGIDELARARGAEVHAQVSEMTRAAMEGDVPLDEVFAKRLELIRPDRALCEEVADQYIQRIVPGARQLAAHLRRAGWTPVIVSGGFSQLIRPLAAVIGIEHVEAVRLDFDESGAYAGYQVNHPATRAGGKCDIVREWREALMPKAAIMMGDGASDLETHACVDAFVCYSGVANRPAVTAAADLVIEDLRDAGELVEMLDKLMSGEKINLPKINLDFISNDVEDAAAMSSKKIAKKAAAKPAEKAPATTNPTKGKRYSDEEKKEVLDFITEYNAKNGRGGQTKAAEKYGVTQITIANWIKSGGKSKVPKAPKAPAAPKAPKAPKSPKAPKAAKPAAAPAPAAAAAPAVAFPGETFKAAPTGDISAKLNRLLKLHTDIAKAKADLASLESEFEGLKGSL